MIKKTHFLFKVSVFVCNSIFVLKLCTIFFFLFWWGDKPSNDRISDFFTWAPWNGCQWGLYSYFDLFSPTYPFTLFWTACLSIPFFWKPEGNVSQIMFSELIPYRHEVSMTLLQAVNSSSTLTRVNSDVTSQTGVAPFFSSFYPSSKSDITWSEVRTTHALSLVQPHDIRLRST